MGFLDFLKKPSSPKYERGTAGPAKPALPGRNLSGEPEPLGSVPANEAWGGATGGVNRDQQAPVAVSADRPIPPVDAGVGRMPVAPSAGYRPGILGRGNQPAQPGRLLTQPDARYGPSAEIQTPQQEQQPVAGIRPDEGEAAFNDNAQTASALGVLSEAPARQARDEEDTEKVRETLAGAKEE